jgi:hypothetical protein
MVAVCVAIMCEGAVGPITATVTAHKFGNKRSPEVFSYVYSAFGFQAIIGSLLVS